MERKRSRFLSSPTGSTPKQKEKLPSVTKSDEITKGKKRLSFSDVASPTSPSTLRFWPILASKWTQDEDKALVEFILLTTLGNSWPQTNNMEYWSSAALLVHQKCSLPMRSCKHIYILCFVLNY